MATVFVPSDLFIKIRMEPSALKHHADKIDYRLLLDQFDLDKRLKEGQKVLNIMIALILSCGPRTQPHSTITTAKDGEGNWQWLPIKITDVKHQSQYAPTQFIYGKYDSAPDIQSIYERKVMAKRRMCTQTQMHAHAKIQGTHTHTHTCAGSGPVSKFP